MPFRLLHRSALLFTAIGAVSSFGFLKSCSRSAAEEANLSEAYAALSVVRPRIATPRPDLARLPSLTAEFPRDIAPPATAGSAASDNVRSADAFSWQAFLALNWPPGPDGEPDSGRLPGQTGDNPSVWETWPEASEIFLPDGSAPSPWRNSSASALIPPEFAPVPPGARVLRRAGKSFADFAPAAPHGPLVDQNGRHVRTEIRVNRPVFDTIVSGGWYRRSTQAASSTPVVFPDGSIRVQAAWKILSPAEVAAGRVDALEARRHTPPAPRGPPPRAREKTRVGLVGFHIASKTPSSPDWIWSTFEHVDNCPVAGEEADRAAYNFYDKTSPGAPINQPPPPPWNPALVEPPARRSQIVRQIPIPLDTRALNASYQAALRAINPASVWQYYQLVGTRRHDSSAEPAAPLVNTTLETYLATDPRSALSCLDCHARAQTAGRASADSSFLLRLAR